MKLYVTYACASQQGNNYSVVDGADAAACYAEVNRVCGQMYAFTYYGDDFAGQAEKYGLTEIPLQAQSYAPASDAREVLLHAREVMHDREDEYKAARKYAERHDPAYWDELNAREDAKREYGNGR